MAIGEWDRRELCPDGGCVGVIGPDGTCKVCGRVAPGWGNERRRGMVAGGGEDAGDDEDAGGDEGGEEDEISPSAPAAIGEAKEWQQRRLCPDGSCIGVIGPDGTCKVCGTAVSGAAAAAPHEDEDEDEEKEEEEDEEEDEDEDEEAEEEESDDEEEAEDEESGDDEEEEDADQEEDADEEDEAAAGGLDDRKLCPDGACIGVIGPDNRCKVCGKEAA